MPELISTEDVHRRSGVYPQVRRGLTRGWNQSDGSGKGGASFERMPFPRPR